MITIFKSTDRGLETIDAPVCKCWVNVVDPTDEEIVQIEKWGILPDFVTHSLDIHERARIEKGNNHILIILRLPYEQNIKEDVPYITIPLGIILTDTCIMTVCKEKTNIIGEFAAGRVSGLSTMKKNPFVLQLFLRTADQYLRYLRDIDAAVDILEDRLYRSVKNKEVLGLLKYQKSLVYFTSDLRSNELMLERLQKGKLLHAYPEDAELLDDVLVEIRQAIEMTGISENILSQMMDAFTSIISNNLNVIMKFMTSMTIVISLPALIGTFYGMNIRLPGQNYPFTFPLLLLVSFIISIAMIIIFWKKNWL